MILLLPGCDQRQQQPIPQQRLKPADPLVYVPAFDAQQSYRYLTMQTDFGPRNPGSEGYRKCLRFLQDELEKHAEEISLQEFTHTNFKGETRKYANIISRFNKDAIVRVMLTASLHRSRPPWQPRASGTIARGREGEHERARCPPCAGDRRRCRGVAARRVR